MPSCLRWHSDSGNSLAGYPKARHIVEPAVPSNDPISNSEGLRREPGMSLLLEAVGFPSNHCASRTDPR
jgi:hypothetical protein